LEDASVRSRFDTVRVDYPFFEKGGGARGEKSQNLKGGYKSRFGMIPKVRSLQAKHILKKPKPLTPFPAREAMH
jgi:hypothetical protein